MPLGLLQAIGNTPLVELRRVVPPGAGRVLVKLEYCNPTGSHKDRMALAVIEGAERRGELKPGMRVVEYTGGSTGSSLAMVCAVKGYRFDPVSSDAFAREKIQTMRAFGAEPILIPSEGGRITPELFEGMKAAIAAEASKPDVFYADQFHNDDVVAGYTGLGNELLTDPGAAGITAFCAAVGSGGMFSGVTRALRAGGFKGRTVAIELAESPTLSTGVGGPHKVEGVGVGFRPPHFEEPEYADIRAVDESAARAMARRLAREEGILAGTSTGLNVAAALQLAVELGPGATVVTIACDSGLKYLAGDLYSG